MSFEDILHSEEVRLSDKEEARKQEESLARQANQRARRLGREAAKYIMDSNIESISLFQETTEGKLLVPEREWSSGQGEGVTPAYMIPRPAYEKYANGWSLYDTFRDGYDKVIREPSIGLTVDGEVVRLSVQSREMWQRGMKEAYQITAVRGQEILPHDRVIESFAIYPEEVIRSRKFTQAVIRLCEGYGPSRFEGDNLVPSDRYQWLFNEGEL